MRTRCLLLNLLCCTAVLPACGQTGNAKIVDVRPYDEAGPSIIAPNNGHPVVIPTSRGMFTLTVALDGMLYSVEVRSGRKSKPADLVVGDPIEAHLEKDKLVVVEPSGKQIKEKIVRRERIQVP